MQAETPFGTPGVEALTVARAHEFVLQLAGAWPRDTTDRRIVQEAIDGKGKAGCQGTP